MRTSAPYGVPDSVYTDLIEARAASQRLGVGRVQRSRATGEWEGVPGYEHRSFRTPTPPSVRTRATGVPYARTPTQYRLNRLAALEEEMSAAAPAIAAELARQHSTVAFFSGEVITVRRRPTPAQRLTEIDRERTFRGGF